MNDIISEPRHVVLRDPAGAMPELTPMQRRVAMLIAVGMRRLEVSKALGFSPKTFDSHRTRVMRKMKLDTDVMLSHKLVTLGVVTITILADGLIVTQIANESSMP